MSKKIKMLESELKSLQELAAERSIEFARLEKRLDELDQETEITANALDQMSFDLEELHYEIAATERLINLEKDN